MNVFGGWKRSKGNPYPRIAVMKESDSHDRARPASQTAPATKYTPSTMTLGNARVVRKGCIVGTFAAFLQSIPRVHGGELSGQVQASLDFPQYLFGLAVCLSLVVIGSAAFERLRHRRSAALRRLLAMTLVVAALSILNSAMSVWQTSRAGTSAGFLLISALALPLAIYAMACAVARVQLVKATRS